MAMLCLGPFNRRTIDQAKPRMAAGMTTSFRKKASGEKGPQGGLHLKFCCSGPSGNAISLGQFNPTFLFEQAGLRVLPTKQQFDSFHCP